MNETNSDRDILRESFSEYLKSRNFRHTTERNAIFEKICRIKTLFTPDMIRKQLEDEDHFYVSRASIYNTIELLLDANIVIRLPFTSTNIQYGLKCIAEQRHYTVCTCCGTIGEIKNEKINKHFSGHKIPKFTTEYFTLYFYGICSKCKYRQIVSRPKR